MGKSSLVMQKYIPTYKSQPSNLFFIATITMGVLSAAAIIVAAIYGDKKWIAAAAMGVTGLILNGIFIGRLKLLYLLCVAFLIPLRIDFYLIFKRTYYIESSYPGLPITAFDIIFFLLLAQYLFDLIKGKKTFSIAVSLLISSLTFALLSGLSTIQAADTALSVSTFLLIIKSVMVLYYFANAIKSEDEVTAVILGLILAVFLQSLVGALQFITGGAFLQGVFGVPQNTFYFKLQGTALISRVGGTIGHANSLARFLNFCIPVFLTYAFVNYKSFIGKMALPACLFGGLTLILTMSRGCWAALGLTSFYLFYSMGRYLLKSRVKALIAVFLINTAIPGIILATFEDVRTRLFEDDYNSAENRIPLAETAINVISDNPLSGVGLNNYTRVAPKYDHTNEWLSYKWPHPVHNSFLLIAAESGIPALIAFLSIIVSLANKMRPALKNLGDPLTFIQIGCAMGIANWMISGLFDRDFAGTNTMLWFMMGFMLALQKMFAEKRIISNES